MTISDGYRTVTGDLVRESRLRIWLVVRGQLHGFAKRKWAITDGDQW